MTLIPPTSIVISGRATFGPRRVRIAALLIGILVVAGCAGAQGQAAGPVATTTIAPVEITAIPAAGATDTPITAPVVITSERGKLRDVAVTTSDATLSGSLSLDGTRWTSASTPEPDATYHVSVGVIDDHGTTSRRDWTFTTGDPPTVFHARLSPDAKSVGIGMPITVVLSQPLAAEQRAKFEARLTVTATPTVAGAWHWFSATELHWRPAQPWPAHTDVTVDAHLEHYDAGADAWGTKDVHTHFTIGDAHLSVVDVAAHTMTVTNNKQVVKTLAVSTGRDQYPTRGGTHVISEKDPSVVMDSATVGIPSDAADGYFETVNWSLRISNSGEFVHAAPWSTGAQGNSNVSHGCVNLSDADGHWFFDFSQIGDIVQVNGSPTQLEPTNGYGDWQIPWTSWAT